MNQSTKIYNIYSGTSIYQRTATGLNPPKLLSMAAPMPAPAYDLRCSLLEKGRQPQPQPQASTVAPRLVPKPKKTNPPRVGAFRVRTWYV